jgi:hypothetical protein
LTAEPKGSESEGTPVEVRIELLGDGHLLSRQARCRLVLEVNRVRQLLTAGDEILIAETSWTDDVVGIAWCADEGAAARAAGAGR